MDAFASANATLLWAPNRGQVENFSPPFHLLHLAVGSCLTQCSFPLLWEGAS